MSKTLVLTLATLVALSANALAQVATPSFTPGMPRIGNSALPPTRSMGFAPTNPAAMQWAMSSHIAVGQISGEHKEPATAALDLEGDFYGLRWVGTWLSLGVESMANDGRLAGLPFDIENEREGYALAGLPLSWLAVGGGKDTMTLELPIVMVQTEFETTRYGASAKVFDVLYVGYAVLSETVERSVAGVPNLTDDRDGSAWGVAVRGGEAWRWRIEHSQEDRDDIQDQFGVNQNLDVRTTETQAELVGHDVLLGYSTYEQDASKQTTAPVKVEGTSYDIGYAPLSGITVLYRHEESKLDDGLSKADESFDSILIGWAW